MLIPDWLNFVVSSKAISEIKKQLKADKDKVMLEHLVKIFSRNHYKIQALN